MLARGACGIANLRGASRTPPPTNGAKPLQTLQGWKRAKRLCVGAGFFPPGEPCGTANLRGPDQSGPYEWGETPLPSHDVCDGPKFIRRGGGVLDAPGTPLSQKSDKFVSNPLDGTHKT